MEDNFNKDIIKKQLETVRSYENQFHSSNNNIICYNCKYYLNSMCSLFDNYCFLIRYSLINCKYYINIFDQDEKKKSTNIITNIINLLFKSKKETSFNELRNVLKNEFKKKKIQ